MYKAPLIVGVRQYANWQAGTVKDLVMGLGGNTGNMMFTESLLRVVGGAKHGGFAVTDKELEGRDVVVLAAANWINSFQDFGWLANRLESIKLPVLLVGVGAQASLNMEVPKLNPGTLKLLGVVNDRSVSMAARGAFSCEVLASYGFKNAVPTGCPSLLLAGSVGPSISSSGKVSESLCCIHSTRHGFNRADPFHTYLYRKGFQQGLDIILQSESADINVALDRPEGEYDLQGAMAVLKSSYGTEDAEAIKRYLTAHARVFANFQSWIAYMKTRDFCLGTRIHGTVASIVAGTAATLIVHDSRTLEMAESMSIPFVRSSDIDLNREFRASEFLRPEQSEALKRNYPVYRRRFIDYFRNNSVAFMADASGK